VNGAEVDDGFEEETTSKMGLWLMDFFSSPLGINRDEETELPRGVS
jgi:hypothetical protein